MSASKHSLLPVLAVAILMAVLPGCKKDDASTVPNSAVIETSIPKSETIATKEPVATPTSAATDIAPSAEPDSSASDIDWNKEPGGGMFDPWLIAKTGVSYSSGMDSDWSYGNQRKEFTSSKPCYVRIGSAIVAVWHWGWRYGEGNSITVKYRFTGSDNCLIEVSDGFATQHETDVPNTIEFTRTLTAKGSDDEDVAVFRYTPTAAGSVTIEVIYDNQVNSQYDERNTIYFIDGEDW